MVIDANASDVNATSAILRKYTWGLDLSGTIHGAGGIGGLLACVETQGEHEGTYWYFYDANGNVGQLVKTIKDGQGNITGVESTLAARYEYDPYGNPIPIPQPPGPGPYADLNPFRFSTKWFDAETFLGYWGYRYYSPRLGRWISRDPIEEKGGANLYLAFDGAPANNVDARGELVFGWLDRSKAILTMADEDTLETISVWANTGGHWPEDLERVGMWVPGPTALRWREVPAPAGRYFITTEPGFKHWHEDGSDWFGLFMSDWAINDKFYDKERDQDRDGVRLHSGTLSWGCVTVFKDQFEEWQALVSMIYRTKPGGVITYGFWGKCSVKILGMLEIRGQPLPPGQPFRPEPAQVP